MSVLRKLAKAENSADAYEIFETLCENPERTQRLALREILDENAECEFGREHAFADIADADAYRRNVPISVWDDYENYAERMGNGESDILFKGVPTAFISTSGTSGSPKLIPETSKGSLAKNVTDKLRSNFTFGAHPEIPRGKILPLVNASKIGITPAGIPYGTASGLTLKSAPPELLATCAYPLEVLNIEDSDASDYALLRFALASDVRIIIGNNLARMRKLAETAERHADRIIRDIENGTLDLPSEILREISAKIAPAIEPLPERARELRGILDSGRDFKPSEYWPNLKVVCCWLSGSVGSTVAAARGLFSDDTEYLDYGYGASEGKFNIPFSPGRSEGTLSIHAGFYEFLPEDADSAKNPVTLLAHQLEDGKRYRMILTNFAGLYRYDMKDIVQVVGFTGKTPNIVFVSKTGDIGNVAGEKLAGSTIANAARSVASTLDATLVHVEATPNASPPPRYEFRIELATNGVEPPPPAKFAEIMDAELRKDIGYGNKRRDNLLAPPTVEYMPDGWLESIYEAKGAEGSARAQIKLPIVVKERNSA